MDDALTHLWREIVARPDGPLAVRFYLQPLVSTLLALRDGVRDAREEKPPYVWGLFTEPARRRDRLREGWRAVARIFTIALVLDLAYQLVVLRGLRPVQGLLVATALAIVPYALLRGPFGRIARLARRGNSAPGRAVSGSRRPDERALRHPWERPVLVGSLALNAAVLAAALALAVAGADWLATHPWLAGQAGRARVAAMTAVVALPGLVVLRNARRGLIRGNSIRLSPAQIPLIYGLLERHCTALGMRAVPELYMSDTALAGIARAYSAWRGDYIVLGTQLNGGGRLNEIPDVIAFTLGRELGRIRLGHTSWVNEVLLAFVSRTPLLKNPLSNVRTYSLDRYGAFLAPDGLRGLLVLAAGRDILSCLNVAEYLKQVQEPRDRWGWLWNLLSEEPQTTHRIKALYDAGLFELSGDVRRFSAERAAGVDAVVTAR